VISLLVSRPEIFCWVFSGRTPRSQIASGQHWAASSKSRIRWALCRYRHKAHLLRDLKGLYDFEPGRQEWASQMADLLVEARDAASAARQAGQSALDAVVLDDLVTRYRQLAAAGLAANLYRRTATAKDARRIARRFLGFEDLILRFATRADLDIFSNNEAERTIRPGKSACPPGQIRNGRSARSPWPKAYRLLHSILNTAR
jgi:hypothetical protein